MGQAIYTKLCARLKKLQVLCNNHNYYFCSRLICRAWQRPGPDRNAYPRGDRRGRVGIVGCEPEAILATIQRFKLEGWI